MKVRVRVPFSFSDRLIIESMNRLGISKSDFFVPPMTELVKECGDITFAQKMKEVRENKVKELCDRVIEEKKMLENIKERVKLPDNIQSGREPGKKLIEKKARTSNDILRRVAISEFRELFRKQKVVEINHKVDELSNSHAEKLKIAHERARSRSESTKSTRPSSKLSNATLDKSRVYGEVLLEPTNTTKINDDRSSITKKVDDKLFKRAHEKSQLIYEQTIQMRQKSVEKTNAIISELPALIENKQRRWSERIMKIENNGKIMREKKDEAEEERKEKLEKELKEKFELMATNTGQAQSTIESKIDEERKRLLKQTEAANRIFSEQVMKREKYRKFLYDRDESIEKKIADQKKNMEKDLFDRMIKRQLRSEDAKRVIRSKEFENQSYLKKRLIVPSKGNERLRDNIEKEFLETNKEFYDKRKALLEQIPSFCGLSSEKQVRFLVNTLSISFDEAKEILESAKSTFVTALDD